ncbi:hypothetical protein J4438_02350 [Candidatus Woesearchaeota archaeon]|nr:hypothetical protein [Candidatus Woesearchaeota archaeon]
MENNSLEGKIVQGELFQFEQETPVLKEYKIPGMTEIPANIGMKRTWLKRFFDENNMPRPKGLTNMNARKLTGLYYSTLRAYDIEEGRIIRGTY